MSTASEPVAATGTTASTASPTLLVRGLAAAGIATVVNVVLLLVATAAGAAMAVAMGGSTMVVGIAPVIVATILPLAIGAVVAWLLARRWPRTTKVLAWVGLVLAVASTFQPLTAATEPTSGVTLAIMHLVAGGSFFAALMARRSR
ncbi:DUF6069 family protein [Agrococcus jejuensis]|uniref:Uncharacterized protein n=1 Tax=Agrococcus jejuensis TaxID=399736 RepID=A0A1G8DX07_9MICO|nr:DUF6069 family protein [Agrococcus jejuensis]SDH62184.1 hypothetical protein SAMN04489720_1808 [Agrococcus jejuensis]